MRYLHILISLCWLTLPATRLYAAPCGEPVSLETHDGTTTRYALARPQGSAAGPPTALVLLVGSGGNPNLDEQGCPTSLGGNSLNRMRPLFHQAGFVTALVDAPSDHLTGDGLAGFRISPEHAADLGLVVADLRNRFKGPVWVLGTSRGSISAANAAARLQGPARPDGLVLTSILTSGDSSARKRWVGQTVFDLPLEAIEIPALLVGHSDDGCLRSPPEGMARVAQRIASGRQQTVIVTGGSGSRSSGLEACEGKSPHGFVGQEQELADGITRFIRGGRY